MHRSRTATLIFTLTSSVLFAAPAPLVAEPAAGTPGRFEREIRKKGCELLTPSLVASTFGVPEAELEQRKLMGCFYEWEKDGQELRVTLMSLRTQKTVEAAKRWFHNSTKNVSREEVKEQTRQIQARLEEKGKVKTATEKSASKAILGGVADKAGPGGFRYSDLPGVGDEARISENDGGVYVRISNLQFTVQAYQGPVQPQMKPTQTRDMKAMMQELKEMSAAWEKKTLPDRKRDSTKIARALADAMK